MKSIIIVFISIMVFSSALFSQNQIDEVLAEIEKNNTTLKALRDNMTAAQLGNQTGKYLENPQLGFNYLWGDPAVGNRYDITFSQSFDFPTAYGYRNQIAEARDAQSILNYRKERNRIMLQARKLCLDLIYVKALKKEFETRLVYAEAMAKAYQLKYEKGEVSILEHNKAQLNLLNFTSEIAQLDVESDALRTKLITLNGGNAIVLMQDVFQVSSVPADFEQWYTQMEEHNPELKWLRQAVLISQNQEKLNTAMSLPKLQAGFMGEYVVGETFQGITLGLSVPLWENKNTVKQAKATTLALQSIQQDRQLQFYNELKILHSKSFALQRNFVQYKKKLSLYNSSDLLQKALEKGEISFPEYVSEISIYYECVNRLLELERDMNKAIADLNRFVN